MKKGVVLSVNKFSITLLTPNGEFEKCRRLQRNYEIGEEISYQPTENSLKSLLYFSSKKTAVISAVVTCIMLFSIMIPRFSTHVSAYMTIDVNPSIELGLDDELQVVEMEGINADGKRVISQINEWKNKDVSDVAEKIVLKTKELGYINDSHRKIIFSKTMIEDNKELDKQLNQEIKSLTNDISIPNTKVKLIQATENDRNKAKQQGISTGKFIEQKLEEEKRENQEVDLEKKKGNKNQDEKSGLGEKKDNPSKNTSNSCIKDNKVSKKVNSKETYNSKNVNDLNQNVTANHHTSVVTNKNNQKDKSVVKTNKVNHIENKGQKTKENLNVKNNAGKEEAMVKSNVDNKDNTMVKKSIDNKENTMAKKSVDNKESSKTKNNQGNKRKSSSNKGNSKVKSNPGHSGYKGNSGIMRIFIKAKQEISIK